MWPPLRSAAVRSVTSAAYGQPVAREPGEDPRVERRAQVVRVGDERVAVAALEQRAEHPRRQQRRVDVAVARRAPLQRRVVRPLGRVEPLDEQLGLLVLDEVERHVGGEVRVALEQRERVVARAERVHQHEREPRAVLRAQREHLAGDDVEEGQAVLDLEQRLRLRHPHRGAQAAVELDHHGRVERRVAARAAPRRRAGRARARSRTRAPCPTRPPRAARSSGGTWRSRRRGRPRAPSSPRRRRGSSPAPILASRAGSRPAPRTACRSRRRARRA